MYNSSIFLSAVGSFLKSKSLVIGSAASVGARITTVTTMLVTTAIATRMMTREEFGLWAIFITFIYLSWILDFGFRYGMGNRLASLVAQSGGAPTQKQKELFLTIFFFQGLIGFIW